MKTFSPRRIIAAKLRIGIITIAISHGAGTAAELRTWTPAAGEPVQAEFLTMEKQGVVLSRAVDNSRAIYPIDQLGAGDREWLKSRAASRTEPLDSTQLAALIEIPEDHEGIIRLPLRVHLINGIAMNKDGVSMRMWMTPREVEETVLPEINRIWAQAGIQWTLECVIDRPFEEIQNHQEAITLVQNSSRQPDNRDERKRVPAIRELSGVRDAHPVVHNLYLFPFLGSTYQGFAEMGGNTAFLGVWSNKPSHGEKPPQRCLLVEKEPMRIGSIGRTAGHELGHNLGLKHPEKETQSEFNRLMGGIKQGYNLTPQEIKAARSEALERAVRIKAWAAR